MKIFIPVDNNDINADICKVFARAPYFYVYDASKNEYQFLKNDAQFSESGAGVKAAQFIVDQGADVVITMQCGEKAASILQLANIKVCKAQSNNITSNLKAFLQRDLNDAIPHPGYHNR